MKNSPGKSIIVAALVLGLLVGGLLYGIRVAKQMANDKRKALEQLELAKKAARDKESLANPTPARNVFDPAFLQATFGDNPLLLAIIRQQLQEATAGGGGIIGSDLALFAVNYQTGDKGEPLNTVTFLLGDLKTDRAPGFSQEGHFREKLPPGLYDVSNSLLAIVGREIQLLGPPETVEEHRDILEGIMGGDTAMLQAFMFTPQKFRGIFPDPGRMLPAQFRPLIKAIAINADISVLGGKGEITFVANDRSQVPALAELIARWRTLAIATVRVRFGAEKGGHIADVFANSEIYTQGPAVIMRGEFDKSFVDITLRAARAAGLANRRIERSPEKVRPPDVVPSIDREVSKP